MSLDPALLRQSFDIVVEREPELTLRFYDVLFSRFPQAKSLFAGTTVKRQAEMLQGALVAVLEHLEDASWLVSTLGGLGQKHVAYGVTTEMYGWVGESLIATLAEAAGDAWTPELEGAWAEAYGAITGLMLDGAAKEPLTRAS
ncbi:MAG TPA: globin domain-containing protein [Polyangiaceae bacterium]|jgi:hemoglobin-like flavoprotein|nr:globin domain-containing protein [Polyangiaceae bacterium]